MHCFLVTLLKEYGLQEERLMGLSVHSELKASRNAQEKDAGIKVVLLIEDNSLTLVHGDDHRAAAYGPTEDHIKVEGKVIVTVQSECIACAGMNDEKGIVVFVQRDMSVPDEHKVR